MSTIRLEVDERIEWYRPLVAWFLCIPHLAWNAVLTATSALAWLVSLPIVLATGRLPRRIGELQVLVLRERARTFACLFALRRTVPPIATKLSAADPGDDPHQTLSVELPDRVGRLAVLRVVPMLLHAVVLLPIGFCLDALYPLWMVLVAANRGWPGSMANQLAAVERWVVELLLYVTMASNDPPAFGLATDRATSARTA
jgi:hypothetical protein